MRESTAAPAGIERLVRAINIDDQRCVIRGKGFTYAPRAIDFDPDNAGCLMYSGEKVGTNRLSKFSTRNQILVQAWEGYLLHLAS
ncbi:hypothetical protein W02_40680 [Nitrospira sp. KM1]|nr:hypothetical protein W02_40680 [Nitrospira sp. KM1]